MTIAAVILAGGKGKRIGGNKPLLMLGGVSLLDRAAAHASGLAKSSAVAVREERQVGNVGISVIRDDLEIEGPLGGLAAALRFARDQGASAALTIPADMPFLPRDLAERLLEALPGLSAAIACSGGHLHPVCGLWSVGALDSLSEYLASGRRSLKGFAEAVGYVAVDWPTDPFDPFFNINLEPDLREAERMLTAWQNG